VAKTGPDPSGREKIAGGWSRISKNILKFFGPYPQRDRFFCSPNPASLSDNVFAICAISARPIAFGM
jgi:hypothetical protein